MRLENTKEARLKRIRYHWHSYIARGGFNEPKMNVGKLEDGGLKHWALFLQMARIYLQDYPKDRYVIEGFVPSKTIRLLTGE